MSKLFETLSMPQPETRVTRPLIKKLEPTFESLAKAKVNAVGVAVTSKALESAEEGKALHLMKLLAGKHGVQLVPVKSSEDYENHARVELQFKEVANKRDTAYHAAISDLMGSVEAEVAHIEGQVKLNNLKHVFCWYPLFSFREGVREKKQH